MWLRCIKRRDKLAPIWFRGWFIKKILSDQTVVITNNQREDRVVNKEKIRKLISQDSIMERVQNKGNVEIDLNDTDVDIEPIEVAEDAQVEIEPVEQMEDTDVGIEPVEQMEDTDVEIEPVEVAEDAQVEFEPVEEMEDTDLEVQRPRREIREPKRFMYQKFP